MTDLQSFTLMMASAQVVETSVNTNNSPSQDYTTNPDDHSNHNISSIFLLITKCFKQRKYLFSFVTDSNFLYSGGVGAVVKISASQSRGPRFDSRPGQGLNIWVTFFPAKVHSAFHPPGVGKTSTSIHGPL